MRVCTSMCGVCACVALPWTTIKLQHWYRNTQFDFLLQYITCFRHIPPHNAASLPPPSIHAPLWPFGGSLTQLGSHFYLGCFVSAFLWAGNKRHAVEKLQTSTGVTLLWETPSTEIRSGKRRFSVLGHENKTTSLGWDRGIKAPSVHPNQEVAMGRSAPSRLFHHLWSHCWLPSLQGLASLFVSRPRLGHAFLHSE